MIKSTISCDRCGKKAATDEKESDGFTKMEQRFHNWETPLDPYGKSIHLCHECSHEFEKWLSSMQKIH